MSGDYNWVGMGRCGCLISAREPGLRVLHIFGHIHHMHWQLHHKERHTKEWVALLGSLSVSSAAGRRFENDLWPSCGFVKQDAAPARVSAGVIDTVQCNWHILELLLHQSLWSASVLNSIRRMALWSVRFQVPLDWTPPGYQSAIRAKLFAYAVSCNTAAHMHHKCSTRSFEFLAGVLKHVHHREISHVSQAMKVLAAAFGLPGCGADIFGVGKLEKQSKTTRLCMNCIGRGT